MKRINTRTCVLGGSTRRFSAKAKSRRTPARFPSDDLPSRKSVQYNGTPSQRSDLALSKCMPPWHGLLSLTQRLAHQPRRLVLATFIGEVGYLLTPTKAIRH